MSRKTVSALELSKPGFVYKITPKGEGAVIPDGLKVVFPNLDEACLKAEEYIITGQILGGPLQIKEISVD